MNREHLLNLVAQYAETFPEEAGTAERFQTFISAHPDCCERSLAVGHITGSAWVVDAAGERVLLTHHRKLNLWLQLGGHADGNQDVLAVAFDEAREESGIAGFEAVTKTIFDLDVHGIPGRKSDPAHDHYDMRFVLRTTGSEAFTVSDESHDLAWVPLGQLEDYTTGTSMLRMRDKWLAMRARLNTA